jgi:hypothetical protein
MWSIPGKYRVLNNISRQRSIKTYERESRKRLSSQGTRVTWKIGDKLPFKPRKISQLSSLTY